MRKTFFCFGGRRVAKRMSERAPMADGCVFCDIARRAPTSTTTLLYSDDKVVAFRDINPSAFRHYLVIPIDHISTVISLRRTKDDHQLVSHMVKVGKDLLNQDAPNSEEHRFGFHEPPFNSVYHLHLHCLALPFMPSWRQVKYTPLGPLGGFIEAEKLLERIKPEAEVHYLVIPIDHIPTVNSLRRTKDDHQLVSHMVKVGKDLLNQDAPNSEEHRFGFHQPPFNSVDHLHLHCLALPFMPSWRQVKYTPLGPLGGFIEAEKLLERIKPEAEVYS